LQKIELFSEKGLKIEEKVTFGSIFPHITGTLQEILCVQKIAKNCTFFGLFQRKVLKIGVILTFLPNSGGKIGHYRSSLMWLSSLRLIYELM